MPDVQQTLLKEGVLLPMVKALEIDDINCQRFSALCLANLATTIASQIKVVQAGRYPTLGGSSPQPDGPTRGRRYAVFALANLSATVANHAVMIEEGVLHALFSLSNSAGVMSQYYVGCALANLSCAVGNHAIMVEQGGLQPLITLAYRRIRTSINKLAAALRRSLCKYGEQDEGRAGGRLGAFDKIISVGGRGDPARGLSPGLNNLSLGDETSSRSRNAVPSRRSSPTVSPTT